MSDWDDEAGTDFCPDCGRAVEYVDDNYRHVDPLAACFLYGARRRLRWDTEAWAWVDDATGEALTFEEVEALGLDATGRTLG